MKNYKEAQLRSYIIAMVNMEKENEPHFKMLNTGKFYEREEAMSKAKELNETCQGELKALDYDSFIAYSIYSE